MLAGGGGGGGGSGAAVASPPPPPKEPHAREPLGARVKELTSSMAGLGHTLGKVVLSTTKATGLHRRVESREGLALPEEDARRSEVVDEYGFTIAVTPEQAEALARCEARVATQRDKWAAWPPGGGGGLPPEERLKKLCRRGVPPELRPWVWVEVSGAGARRTGRHPSYYSAMAQLGKYESPFAHQIRLDVPRTFPSNTWVQSEEGQAALGRVLYAFARHKPDVGYCQGMNYIAALLLLALRRSEEDAFWVLASLIDDESQGILYQDMYAHDLTGTHVEMRSLRELVERKLPRLAAHLAALGCDMSLLATDWFLCLFATSLPDATAARVWDALLHEGPKVLFRVALALLKLHEPLLLAQDNPGEVLRAMRSAAAQAHDRDELMRVAFEGVGSLPMDTIRRHRARKQAEVDHEMAARETRAAARRAAEAGLELSQEEVEELFREPGQQSNPLGAQPSDAGRGASSSSAGGEAAAQEAGQLQEGVVQRANSNRWRSQLAALGERTRETLDRSKHKLGSLHRRGHSISSN